MRLRYLDGQRDCWTTYMKHAECSEAAMHISQISVCRILYGTNTKGLSFPMRICGSRPRYGSRSYPHGVDWCDGGANSTYEPNRISLCAQGHLPTNRPCNEISSFQILYQYPELLLNILHYLLLNYNFKAQARILCMDLKDSKCSGWLRVSSLENSLNTSLKTQTYAIRLVSWLRTYHIIRMPQLSVFSHTSGAEVRGQYRQGSLNGRTFSIWWMQVVFCLWARMFLLI